MKTELYYHEGIAITQLKEYIKNHYEAKGAWVWAFISNVIDYGRKYKQVTKDSFMYFLYDLIPDFSMQEAAAFIDDKLLTDYGQSLKQEFWSKYEAQEARKK